MVLTVLRRTSQLVGLPAMTGAVVGLGAAGLFWVVNGVMLPAILGAPLAVGAIAPCVGLAVAVRVLDRRGRGRLTPATVDEYLLAFHEPDRALEMRELPSRMVATVATVGLGGAMGLEAPSVFMGSVVGNTVQRRLCRPMEGCDRRVLMVAGAAAGGGAILRAPLTAALFAIESPFQGAVAGRLLIPALAGGFSGYLAFVAVHGDTFLLPLVAGAGLGARELLASALIGVLAGLGGRAFVRLAMRAITIGASAPSARRLAVAGLALASMAVLCDQASGSALTLGPGVGAIRWAISDPHPMALVAVVLALRLLAMAVTVGGGGAGGLTTPLLVGGALIGQIAGTLAGADNVSLMALVGVGAFFAANYRVPLTGVAFVAEATGRPLFAVPAVLASVLGDLLMGNHSITLCQRLGRRDGKSLTPDPS